MKMKVCEINAAALDQLPHLTDDRSGIGVHYVDAYLRPINVTLDDGAVIKCKRRGLKIVLQVGSKTGEGLLRRLDVSRDPVVMLRAALAEAAAAAGVTLSEEDGALYVTGS